MEIKVRKECFGYIFFCQEDRKYFIVEKEHEYDLFSLVKQYFPSIKSSQEIKVIPSVNTKNNLILSAPIGMYMEIASACNLNCGHCYKPEDVNHGGMSVQQIETLIDQLESAGVFEIRLCGNEPTSSKWFFMLHA